MRKLFILIFTLISLIALIYGIINSQWYLLAIPVGLLFGFFLQKGDLCASSAMSEAVMYKDRSKLWGFWVAIVTTMLSFAIIDYFGLINVNPKPLLWMSSIVGGVIFGTGMVLAGGCISGVVYKSGTGNINSIMALMAVPFGVAAVEFGPMNEVHLFMKNFLIRGENGNSVTLYSITGLPYLSLAAAFALLTALYVYIRRKKMQGSFNMALKKSWSPWIAGIAIGILGAFAYLTSDQSGRNYGLGVTHGVLQYSLIATEKSENLQYVTEKKENFKPAKTSPKEYKERYQDDIKKSEIPKKKISVWLVLLVLSMIPGAWMSGALSGKSKLLPKDPSQVLTALIGGLMIGAGAAFAGGCSIGNILSGWGMMSIGNFLFGFVVLLANWTTTYFYLMGGKLGRQ